MAPRPRGLALATTLLVIFILLLLGMTLALLASFESRSVNAQVEGQRAMEAAQTGLAEAMARLAENPDWSAPLEDPAAGYRVTLVNNLQGASGIPAPDGQAVPPSAALLQSHGTSPAGIQRTVQAVVRLESVPWAVASDVALTAPQGLEVSGAGSLETLEAAREPADVYAPSVMVQGSAHVTGEVQYTKKVNLGPSPAVQGGVRRLDEPPALPVIEVAQFDNKGLEGLTTLAPGVYKGLALQGPVRVGGNLTVIGDLVLQDAWLYVDGSLMVQRGLSGTGTVFTTGSSHVVGATELASGRAITLFSQGAARLSGGSFQGTLYSRGDVQATDHVRVLGALMSVGGRLTLTDGAQVTYVAEHAGLAGAWVAKSDHGNVRVRQLSWGTPP